jgi:hypothetical protein
MVNIEETCSRKPSIYTYVTLYLQLKISGLPQNEIQKVARVSSGRNSHEPV